MIFEKTDFESQILALFDNFLVNLQNETILFENTYWFLAKNLPNFVHLP